MGLGLIAEAASYLRDIQQQPRRTGRAFIQALDLTHVNVQSCTAGTTCTQLLEVASLQVGMFVLSQGRPDGCLRVASLLSHMWKTFTYCVVEISGTEYHSLAATPVLFIPISASFIRSVL